MVDRIAGVVAVKGHKDYWTLNFYYYPLYIKLIIFTTHTTYNKR